MANRPIEWASLPPPNSDDFIRITCTELDQEIDSDTHPLLGAYDAGDRSHIPQTPWCKFKNGIIRLQVKGAQPEILELQAIQGGHRLKQGGLVQRGGDELHVKDAQGHKNGTWSQQAGPEGSYPGLGPQKSHLWNDAWEIVSRRFKSNPVPVAKSRRKRCADAKAKRETERKRTRIESAVWLHVAWPL